MTRVFVIGGYGGFGAHLSRRLAKSGHQVIVAGRSLPKAEQFCRDVSGCSPARADRNAGVSGLLAAELPDVVVDASGPFQSADYRLVEECIDAGVSYVDLADAPDFVTGIRRFHRAAQDSCVAIVSGASSVPALSGAVVRKLAQDLQRVTSVEIAISASSRAAAGPAVTSAIVGGVGQPIELWRGQRRFAGYGWQDIRREHIDVAGASNLGRRLVALADVPDLTLLPDSLPGRPAVTFRAGTESRLAVMALWLLSWPVRWGWVRSLRGLSRFLSAGHRLRALWGGDRSGMIVRLFGTCAERRVERRWTLIADAGDGSQIPTLAAAILVERIANGEVSPGAYDAGGLLELDDFEPLFNSLAIAHATSEIALPPALYRRVMGESFDRLPDAVQAMHDVLRDSGAHGYAQVERGRHPIARILAWAMGFPPAGEHPLHVHFAEDSGRECWTRDFGGRCFSSRLSGAGDESVEQFGPLRFHFALLADGDGLTMEMRRWSVLGVRLPLALAPKSPAREWEDNGRFHFDVPVELPLIGPVVRYRGWLEPPAARAPIDML